MMNKEQLAKVRDALARSAEHLDSPPDYVISAVAILDAALAAPEQEPVVYWNGDRSVIPADEVSYIPNWTDYYPTPLYRHPAPQSQPVARVTGYYGGNCVIEPLDGKTVFSSGMAVYNSAPPSRKWQGLTEDERATLLGIGEYMTLPMKLTFAHAIEAALRAKNSGEQA